MTGRIWIVGEENVRKKPDEVAYLGFLANVNVVVSAHVVANRAVTLNVAFRADLEIDACPGEFANGDMMSGDEPLAETGSLVEHAVRSDERIGADLQWGSVGKPGRVAEFTVGFDDGIFSDFDIIMNEAEWSDLYSAGYLGHR